MPFFPLPPRAVLDACVLYPAPLRDLFMHLSVAGAFQARWTTDIHDEWMRNVLASRPDLTRAQLERTRAMMDQHAEGCLVENYHHRMVNLVLPDPDDRHVLAAAIEAEASVIVTLNYKDFPEAVLAAHGIRRQRPDLFICGLYDQDPGRVCEALRNQRALLKRPPKTVEEHLVTLVQNGLTELVTRLQPHVGDL